MASGSVVIRELLVRLGIDTDEGAINRYDESITRLSSSLVDIAGVAVAAAAAFAAVAAGAVLQAIATGETAESIKEQAAALGVTTDAYQELTFAGAKYGLEADKLTVIMSKLAVDQKAVAEGNEEATATYAALGLSVEEVAAAKPEELFALMADGFTGITDSSQRLALASGLFGDRIASKLIPMLSNGSAGLEEMAKQAHELGVIMSTEDVDAADAWNDRVENLGLKFTSLRNELGLALIPTLTKLADRILAWSVANKALISQKIEEYAKRVTDAFLAVASAISAADKAVGGAEGWARLETILFRLASAVGIAYVVTKFISLGTALWSVGTAVAALVGPTVGLLWAAFQAGALTDALIFLGASAAAATGPILFWGTVIVGVIAGLVGLALAAEDLWTYLEGGDSIWGRLIERWREAPGILGAVSRVMEAWGTVLQALGVLAGDWWTGFAASMQPAIVLAEAFAAVLENKVVAALNAVGAALGALGTSGLDSYAGALTGLAGGLGSADARGAAAASGAGFAAPSMIGAPLAAAAVGRTVNIAGDTITLSGATQEEMVGAYEKMQATKARNTAAAFAAGEV